MTEFKKEGHYQIPGCQCDAEGCEKNTILALYEPSKKGLCREHAESTLSEAFIRQCENCGWESPLTAVVAWHPYPISEIAKYQENEEARFFDEEEIQEIMSDSVYHTWCESCTLALIEAARQGEASVDELYEVVKGV